MRELPEPEGQLAWQTYTRDQILAIQKQAYEDGLRDASEKIEQQHQWITAPGAAALLNSMLTASQKEQQ